MSDYGLLFGFVVLFIVALGIVIYPLRQHRMGVLCLIPVLALLVGGAYWQWGAWPARQRHVQQMIQQQRVQAMLKSANGPQDIINQLKARVNENPTSARGWYLLGRLYTSQNQWQPAYAAFAKAHQLEPDDEQITINYAQSRVALNHQKFDAQSRALFHAVLQKNANQPDALAMLAMDAYMRHAYQTAIDYWQRLLVLAPGDSEEAQAIRQAIAKAQGSMASGYASPK